MKITSQFRVFSKLLISVFVLLSMGASSASSARLAAPSTDLVDICPGVDESKVDKVDVLILLDNSLSLSSEDGGSDIEGKRFDALRTLFQSIAKGVSNIDGSGPRVNVGVSLMAFAQTTKFGFSDQKTGLITLKQSINNPDELANEIKNILTNATQRAGTNYINALDDASSFLASQPNTHCKFLIWFTDGAFDYNDAQLREGKKEKDFLAEMNTAACSPTGWAQKLRDSHVNTYVVLLGDLKAIRKKKFQELGDSLNLMAQVTGDRSTDGLGTITPCPGETPSVVGEIFSVGTKEIGKLTPVFQRIGVAIGGGKDIICPTPKVDTVSTPGLPSSKFFKSISLISLDLQPLPQLDQITVVSNEGVSQPFSDIFSKSSSDETAGSSQIDFTANGGTQLDKGWKIVLSSNLPGFCLMAIFVESPTVQITKLGGNPAQVKQTGSFLTSDELSQLVFLRRDPQNSDQTSGISPDAIMNEPNFSADFINGLSAELEIEADPLNPIFGRKFPINVGLDKPLPDLGQCLDPWVFSPDRPDTIGDTPSNKDFPTQACAVSNVQNGATELLVSLSAMIKDLRAAGCEVEPTLLIDGENRGTEFAIPIGAESTVAINFRVSEKSTACKLTRFNGVEFQYENPSIISATQAAVSFDLKQPPNSKTVMIVTFLAVLAAMLLSLLLLRFISSLLAVMPDARGVYSYEAIIEIGLTPFGQVKLAIGGEDVTSFQPSASDLKRPLASSSKSAIVLQNIRLDRKLSGLFSPFADAKAEVLKSDLVAYWQQTGSGGLAIPFRKAIVVSKQNGTSSSSDGLSAQLTIMVPTSGSEGGINGVTSLLRGQKLKDVCKEYRDKSGNSFGETQNSSESSGSPVPPSPTNGAVGRVAPPAPPKIGLKNPNPPQIS